MRKIFVDLLAVAVMSVIIFLVPEDILTRLIIAYCIAILIYYIADKGWEKK